MTANVSDAAGNAAAEVTSSAFTVNSSLPTIAAIETSAFSWGSVLNATEDNANGTVTVTTTGVDDGQTLTIVLNGANYTGSVSSNSVTVTITDTGLQALDDGQSYTMTANVSDAAGNAAAEVTSSSFSVDTTLPSISAIATGAFSWGSSLNATEDNSNGTVTVTTVGLEDGQTLTLVLNGANAKKLIVSCMKDNELNLVLVDSSANGISLNSFATIDGQSCSEISFENVEVDNSNIIASGDSATDLLMNTINLATLCVSAEAVGCMESCYFKTLEYTKGREQFGQPISNFQVLQHRMVDMFIESELSKSLLIKAMLEVTNNSDDMYKHVSALKSYIGKSGKLSAKEAVQLHGGMGVSEEMMIGHYLKKMSHLFMHFGTISF